MQKACKHSILQAFNLFCIDLRGEGGIRTLGTSLSSYNGLANRPFRPLRHLSGIFLHIFKGGKINHKINKTIIILFCKNKKPAPEKNRFSIIKKITWLLIAPSVAIP